MNRAVVEITPYPPKIQKREIRRMSPPKSTIELEYKPRAPPMPMVMKTEANASYKNVIQQNKSNHSAGFIDDKEPEHIL